MEATLRRKLIEKLRMAEDTSYPDEPFIALNPVDSQALLDFFDAAREERHKWAFSIRMPCGKQRAFDSRADIPLEDLPCPCGREDHYFVKYSELPLGLNRIAFVS